MVALLARKIGMTRMFDKDGKSIPVTLLMADNCVITQIKQFDKEGYNAVQIGLTDEEAKINKPLYGHIKNSKFVGNKLREFRIDKSDLEKYNVGNNVPLDTFQVGQKVLIQGISKGKGYAGTVKRHHFHTGPKTHGSNNYRQPGSIGCGYPEHVIKGKRMSGHMGFEQISEKNKVIMDIDIKNKVLAIKGAIVGPNNNLVYIASQE